MSAPVPTATVAYAGTATLTTDGRLLMAERLHHLRDVAIPELVPLLVDRERDERDTAVFERLTAEADRLEHLLATAGTVVPSGTGSVELGSRVLLRLARGVEQWVRPVDPVEAILDDERISVASPLSRSILGAAVGQTVTVHGPAATWKATILTIE
jgi:transcription elongation GreA/GreB family factor